MTMRDDMRNGQRVRATIDDVAFGGDGVARIEERVVFVPLTVDGDDVEIEIYEIKRNYAKGRVVRIVSPSPFRVSPPCPYYGLCGGCGMQHISYPHQLDLKKRQIEEAMRRIGGIAAPPAASVIPSPEPFGWRGKAEFHLSGGSGKKSAIGLMAARSNRIVAVGRCLVVEESINVKYKKLIDSVRNGAFFSPHDRQVVWADEPNEPPVDVFIGSGKSPDVQRVVMKKRMTVPGRGFFQANIFLVETLVEQVVAMAALTGKETVIDLYGGVGLFSLFLGGGAGSLFCIEGDEEALRCARKNLDSEGIAGAACYQGDAADVLRRIFVEPKLKVDVVVLDPPRDGCAEGAIAALLALMPGRIVYVSCNPATQARDIKKFLESGYCLETVQPLDMFPQTPHVEAVALLTRH